MRRTAAAAAAAVALTSVAVVAIVAVRQRAEPEAPPGRPPLELLHHEGQRFLFPPLPTGTYVAYGLSTGAVHEPVRVVEARPLSMSGDVEFVGSLLSYFPCETCARHPGTYGTKVILGSTCGSTEPHGRGLYRAEGRELVKGDAPSFIVVGRITGQGPAFINGIEVTYRTRGRTYVERSPVHSVRIDTGQKPLDPPCPVDGASEVWFGGSDEGRLTVPLD